MDTTDAAIIRELFYPGAHQWNVRESFATIARNLGIDEETVRVRVRRLEADGVLRGWDLMVNPTLLGRVLHQAIVDLPHVSDKAAFVQRVRHVEGVYWIFENFGQSVGVVAFVEPGAAVERFRQLVEALAGGRALNAPFMIPRCEIEMDTTDWRIMQVLRTDVRRPFEEVAERVGASEKTVRRRLQRMIDGRAVFLNGRVDFSKIRGLLPVQAKVWLSDVAGRAAVEEALTAIPNRTFFNFGSEVPQLSFMAESLADVENVRTTLAALPHVREARAEMLLHRHIVVEWLEEQIGRRAAGPPANAA